jgi:hypothetical protein
VLDHVVAITPMLDRTIAALQVPPCLPSPDRIRLDGSD